MLHTISAVAILIIAIGLYQRKRNQKLHWRLMVLAFAIDISLVLYIELTRQAIEQVVSRVDSLLIFHATISTGVILFYGAMLVLGRRLLRGDQNPRIWHRRVAILFCTLRLTNFITRFMVGAD